ncbi:MAG TPA: ADOP family duplicated permease [Vicinamibacterales bacterium]|nr:ADOP family duplicated permease [Vicinamibacterales bacterium]
MLPRSLRSLRAAPGTVGVALLTLTLAIAAATTTFSVVDAIVLRRLPFPDEHRLVAISRITASNPRPSPLAPQDYFAWRTGTSSFEALAAFASAGVSRLGPAGAEAPLTTYRATADLFAALGVRPALGRLFTPGDEVAGSEPVALISHRLWTGTFASDPGAVGRVVSVGREQRRIVGVLPPEFTFPVGSDAFTDVWVPYVPRDRDRDLASASRGYSLQVVGRLRSGVTLEQARADVERVRDHIFAEYPTSFWADARPRVVGLRDHVIGPASGWMLLVLGAVALVLLVACVNVANLLLARATSRHRDLAVQRALGASRTRLFSGVLLESGLLAAASAAAGVLLSVWAVDAARALLPEGLSRTSDIALDGRVLSAACLATAVTAIVCGLAPAWHAARTDVVTLMKGDATFAGLGSGGRLRSLFLVVEVAFVIVLLVGTTLFVTSFLRVSRADLGFNPQGLMGLRVLPNVQADDDEGYRQRAQLFFFELTERVSAVPGVMAVGIHDGRVPLQGGGVQYSISGFGSERGEDLVDMRAVSPGYLAAAQIRIIEGRPILASDVAMGPRVALVNDVVARRYYQNRSPVGSTIDFRGPLEIVGVVQAVLAMGPEVEPRPELYFPIAQHPLPRGFSTPMIVARLGALEQTVMPAIQEALRDVRPAAPQAREVFSFEAALDRLNAQRRFSAALMSLFGLLALLIGAGGVYAVVAFAVARRTREIGIRLAIGASSGQIIRAVLGQAGRDLTGGVILGLLAAWAVSGVFTALLFEVQPTEVGVYAVAAGVLLAVGLAAAAVPAIRATRIDPLAALRTE